MRFRLDSSAAAWNKRADMLLRLERSFDARPAAESAAGQAGDLQETQRG